MKDKERKNIGLLGWLLIVSLIVNIYQYARLNSTKRFEQDAAHKKFIFVSSNLQTMSNSIEDFIKSSTDADIKRSQDNHKLFATWNAVYSQSKDLEFKLSSINERYFSAISKEIAYTRDILAIINKKLYTLNIEFLEKNPQSFALTDEEKETLSAVAAIYGLMGNGIKTEPSIVFTPGLFEQLIIPLKKIDSSGWCEILEREITNKASENENSDQEIEKPGSAEPSLSEPVREVYI